MIDLEGKLLFDPSAEIAEPQSFVNGEIHDWYRIILGYSDKIVSHLLATLELSAGAMVLDPFCGTGTTLVECKKKGIISVGVDANPSSCFATRVKTDWRVDPEVVLNALSQVQKAYEDLMRRRHPYRSDPSYRYICESGMIERGWISPVPLRKCIGLKQAICRANTESSVLRLLNLALVNVVVRHASNVKFGPELYCSKKKFDADVIGEFSRRVNQMADDLRKALPMRDVSCDVFAGDARTMKSVPSELQFDAIISSPPYPTEHDYTRNSRLELAFLEEVTCREELRGIKKNMIRSHTKGIYKHDSDANFVSESSSVNDLADQVRLAVHGKTSGFQKLYPTVVTEYFGGMARHFQAARPLLKVGGYAAYVVGDQASFARIKIPTAEVLADIAVAAGFEVVGIQTWRNRWSTTTAVRISENILLLRNPV